MRILQEYPTEIIITIALRPAPNNDTWIKLKIFLYTINGSLSKNKKVFKVLEAVWINLFL